MNDEQLNQLLDMLESSSVDDRRSAIKQLANSRDSRALRYLAEVYKNDPEPELRDLAVKAGRHLKKQIEALEWESSGTAKGPETPTKKYNVSVADQDEAQGLMDSAMDYHTRQLDDRAEIAVRKAFQLNPNLEFDPYSVGVAQSILGLSGDALIQELKRGEIPVPNKAKRKRGSEEAPTVSWGEASIDLLIYFVVQAAIVILGGLVTVDSIRQVVEAASSMDPAMAEALAMTGSYDFLTLSVPLIIVFAIITAIITTLFLVLLHYLPIHVVATMMFTGEGTLTGLIHKTILFISAYSAVSAIVGFYVYYQQINLTLEIFRLSAIQDFTVENAEYVAIIDNLQNTVGMLQTIMAISFFGGLAALAFYGYLVGKTYDFGTFKGCASILIGSIIIFGFACLIIWSLLSSVMTDVMMQPPAM